MSLDLKFDIAWRMGADGALPVPDLLFQLLDRIEQEGSISAAARTCNTSYRHAWNLLQQWRNSLGVPLIVSRRGQGATLARMGKALLWGYRYAREESASPLRTVEERVVRELRALTDPPSGPSVQICASHCLSHPALSRILEQECQLKSEITIGGSARCLQSLTAGNCLLAGFHLAEGPLAAGFVRDYLRDFEPQHCRLIHAVRRRQGLMVRPGNPLQIVGVQDLTREGLRFVNRQAGSGTRMMLDLLLQDLSMDTTLIRGYDHVEFTHSAVSAMVAGGAVDAGVGAEAAAASFGLDFIPLASEVYYYAARKAEWQHPGVQAVHQLLCSRLWRKALSTLDGYDPSDAGAILDADEIFRSPRM